MKQSPIRNWLAAAVLAAICAPTRADGPAGLRDTLERLERRAPVTAELRAEVWNANGEGEDRHETEGAVAITLADGAGGFQLRYGEDMLARLDAERQQLVEDPDVPTPTLEALREFTPGRLQSLLSAAARLRRSVDRSRFLRERPAEYDGRPARLLTFERDIDTVSERERKYVKQFESLLHI